MKPFNFILIFFFCALCFLNTGICQPLNTKPYKTLNVKDGLPQSFISGLIQDSVGFIWIGTRDGLARYDGRSFKIFRHVPGDSTTLADNIISNLFLDKEGRLWIFFEAGDIDILNTSTEALFHFTKDSLFKTLFALIGTPQSIAEDQKGNFWFLSSTEHIYICNLLQHTLQLYSTTALGLPNDSIAAIKEYKGSVMFLTSTSLIFLNYNRTVFKTVAFTFDSPYIKNLYANWKATPLVFRKNGDIVIVDERRIIIYNLNKQQFTIIPLNENNESSNYNITDDENGQIFFDYNYSVYTLSPGNKLSIFKPKSENPMYGFKSMLADRSGVLWLGGNGSGIQLYDLRLPRLSGIPYAKNFQSDVLQTFLQVPQNEIEKTPLNPALGYFIRWTNGTDNDLWIASAGLQTEDSPEVYHYINGHLLSPSWHYTDTVKAHHVHINSLAMSSSGKLWGIDFYMRPVYFDTLTHAVTVYPPLGVVNTSYSFTVSSLFIDKDEKFWISTALNGLFLFDKPHNRTVHFTAGLTNGSLPTNQLMNIVQDAKNTNVLWIGSMGGGLIKFYKSTGRCTIYTTKQGLPNNTVYAVVADAKGSLWCSSNKGIFSFNPQTLEIRNYTSKDGLPGDEFNRYHYLRLPDGRIAFGGVDGYTVFNPLTISNDSFQPMVAITGVSINNMPADYGDAASPFMQAINNLQQVKLPYNKNFLSFEFAALEYNIPGKLKYRYMLQNFDRGWVNTGNNNVATYTKLPPGNYTFKVNATNTAGEWSRYVKTLSIIIQPPFWQTWWFNALIFLLLVVLVYFFIRSRVTAIQKKERQKIQFEQEASELKAQALRAQMNPHFIFNCLNSIKALIQEDKKQEAVIYLTTFSKLIRTQLNNAEQQVSLHEELETCKLYTQLETLRFGAKIEYQFLIDDNIDTSSLKVPPLIFQPFIENAIWHGILPKQKGKVTVKISCKGNTVICAIEDDGIGRDMAMRNKSQTSSTYESKGMKLVKNRLNLYNTINMNEGTVEVIDKKDKANKPAGTLVIIQFKLEA